MFYKISKLQLLIVIDMIHILINYFIRTIASCFSVFTDSNQQVILKKHVILSHLISCYFYQKNLIDKFYVTITST